MAHGFGCLVLYLMFEESCITFAIVLGLFRNQLSIVKSLNQIVWLKMRKLTKFLVQNTL